MSMNNLGQVTGYCELKSYRYTTTEPGFIWNNGTMTNLGSLNNCYTAALGINDASQIVGYSGGHAFIWQDGVIQKINEISGSVGSGGYDINNNGDIAGFVNTGDGKTHPCLWLDGIAQDLGLLPGYTGGQATVINDNGIVAGLMWKTDYYCGFVWRNGVMQELPTLGGIVGNVYGINSKGQIVGYAYTNTRSSSHAVLWEPVPEPSSLLALMTGMIGAVSASLFGRKK